MTNTIYIIDDERKSRENLKLILQNKFKVGEEIFCFESGSSAMEYMRASQPSLVFLDILMPGESGFEFLERIPDRSFDVILTTAYDEYALRAFEYNVVDYLLKPIDTSRLTSALDKLTKRKRESQYRIEEKSRNQKIAIPTLTDIVLIEIDTIIHCEAESNYTLLHTDNGNFLACRTLKDVERVLKPHGFFRVHHTHLVNLDAIVRYIKGKGGQVVMRNGSILDVSVRRKSDLLLRLPIL